MKFDTSWMEEKILDPYDYRVEVTVPSFGSRTTAKYDDAVQIFRDLEGVQGYRFRVVPVHAMVCKFCGREAETFDDGCPNCCSAAQKAAGYEEDK